VDDRIKSLVVKQREETLDREYHLLEKAQDSLNGNCHRLIDIGCGPFGLLGRKGDRLAGLKTGSLGIDLDQEALARNHNVTHRVCASCYSLPLASNSVDIIVCRWVFEHLETPELAMREFSRVLKKGGFLYVKTPNLWNYGMIFSWAAPTALQELFKSATGLSDNIPTFYRANTERKLKELAGKTAFAVRSLEFRPGSYMYFAFSSAAFFTMRGFSRLVGKVTDRMHQTLLCVMEKAGDA